MFDYFKNRKARQQEEIDLQIKEVEAQEENLRIKIIQLEDEMVKKPCPINKRNCEKECIHFKRGKSYVYYSFHMVSTISNLIEPKCKLWSK